MPEDNKYTRKDKRKAKHDAKVESGRYAESREKGVRKAKKIGASKPSYHESATGAAIKDFVHKVAYKTGITKKRFRTKKIAPGNVGDTSTKTTYKKIDKPKTEEPGTSTRRFVSAKSNGEGKVVEIESKRTSQKASTSKELATKTKEAVKKIGFKKVKDAGVEEAPEFKKNVAAQSEYEKTKARRAEAKKKGKYVKGSRTKQTRERQARNVEEFETVGSGKSYKRRMKSKIVKRSGKFKRKRKH